MSKLLPISNPYLRRPTTVPARDSVWQDVGKTLCLSVLFAFGIRSFVAEARYIPTGSMEPTLLVNDHLLIDKLSYHLKSPKRGDIIVFSATDTLKAKGYPQDFIKRVIGLPGDTIRIQSGKVFVQDQPLEEHYIANDQPTLVDACTYLGIRTPFLATSQVIPADQYLVLGDNRLGSTDSRCWGLVPRSHLIGRAIFRFWPVPRFGPITEVPNDVLNTDVLNTDVLNTDVPNTDVPNTDAFNGLPSGTSLENSPGNI